MAPSLQATRFRIGLVAAACLFIPFAEIEAQVFIDDDFDGAEVSGWIAQGNTRTITEQNITQADSVLSSEVVASQSNTNRGIASETSFEPAAAGGFSFTFVVDSVAGQPGANGYFIGLVRDNDLFYRDAGTRNFGLAFFGIDARTGSTGGFGLVYGDNNANTSADFQLANSDAQGDVDINSFFDGFTATVTVDPAGWSYEITGLLDALGTETTFSDSGTWADAGTSFDALWPAGDQWFAVGSLQVVAATTHTIAFDRITVVGGAGAGGSSFQILSVEFDESPENPNATIKWASRPGRTYAVDFSEDLAVWGEVDDSVPSGGDVSEFVHEYLPSFDELVGAPTLFYRIREGG